MQKNLFITTILLFVSIVCAAQIVCTPNVTLGPYSIGCTGGTLKITSDQPILKVDWYLNNSKIGSSGISGGTIVAGVTNVPGSDAYHLSEPNRIFVDNHDTLYVTDGFNHRVLKFAPGSNAGIVVAGVTGVPGDDLGHLHYPDGVKVDSMGNIYVSDFNNHRIIRFAPGQTYGIVLAGVSGVAGNDNLHLNSPTGLYVDKGGNIYVMDGYYNQRVIKFANGSSSGVVVAGVTGVLGSDNSHFMKPANITFDAMGNLYVADADNKRVMEFNSGSTVGKIYAGETGFSDCALNHTGGPEGLSFDEAGNLYVAEWDNQRVTRFAPGSTTGVVIAGISREQGTDSLHFNIPIDVFYKHGFVYVCDKSNQRIMRYPANPSVAIPTYLADKPGVYTAIVTTAGGIVTSNSIAVGDKPKAAFTDVIVNNKVYFINNSTGATSFRWYFSAAATDTSTQTNPTFVYPRVGNYTAKLVTSSGGCLDSTTLLISILTGVEDVAKNLGLRIYPNPVGATVTVDFEASLTFGFKDELFIVDALGRTVYRERLTASKTVINTSAWVAGDYFINGIFEGKTMGLGKIVK